uniref:Uncharacterized protein n=1 Tax=Fagus sylvatica TaxID=28930 RepID=A0A2N9I521_FAGSY
MEEIAVSGNERGGNRLPTFNHRRLQSEVRVPGGQEEREVQHSRGRTEGRQRSHSRELSFLGEARKKRRIEELEEELKLLKEENKNKDEQHRSRRSRSHSGSCGSPHRVPSRKERSKRSDYKHRRTVSPKRRRRNRSKTPPPQQEQNPIWRKLQQISHSPFSARIEQAKFPAKFISPNLAVYDRKSDPVGHLSRYRQAMAFHNSNNALMCHVFPSSLGEVGLRWFDRLEHRSIRSWKEMSEIFTARFITNTQKPKKIDSLLALTMKAGETLKSYSTRYWEVYNDIDACDEDIVVKTFRVEDDPKSAAKDAEVAPLVDIKAAQPKSQLESRRAKKAKSSTDSPRTGVCLAVYTTFKEPIYRLLPLIKDKPYFEWPPKMPGDPATRETKPYCSYHREQYVDESKSPHQNVEAPRTIVKASTPVGIIDVIHYEATGHDQRGELRRAAHLREVFQVQDSAQMAPTPLRKESVEEIIFNNQDFEGVQLPHSDALVITLRIGEYDVKRILIDPSSSVEIMYESLSKGLGLGKKDLSRTEGPLNCFSGETVIPSGKVTINVRAGTVSSPTEFFVLNAFSPYNAILGRPWLHRIGAVPSTLHQRDSLSEEHKSQLLALLKEYQDVFAWTPYEAPGVDSEFVCHELNVSPEYKPVVQKARRTAPQHAEAVQEEVERLLKIGAIREVLYPQWLSNTVVVKKKNIKWRVCVDFTDLNKACPKDPFPLPKIDQLVDSTAGHERMSFLDAFQGYHQIALRREDQEKTTFITPRGVFCYKVMPFGLKNAGATYQRMVTKMFSELLGKTVEVYIDDMVVKSVQGTDHLEDLRQVFSILRRHSLKLNASKCAFRALFRSSDFSGRISKWGAQLGAYDVRYKPRTAIKGQVLADFIAEFAPENNDIYIGEERPKDTERNLGKKCWVLYVDGATNSRGSGLGIVLISPKGELLEQAVRLGFGASNNEAEYEVLLHGLRAAKRLGADPLTIHYDSQLIVNQLTGEYMAKDERMVAYLDLAKNLLKGFHEFNIERVGREHNGHADSLAGLASSVAPNFRRTITVELGWISILDYLSKDILPANQKEAAKIRKTATRYWVSRKGKLYKKSYTGPYLLCVHPDLIPNLLYEIHEGVCGGHTGRRSLAHRAIGQGYWWPYIQKDAAQYVRRYLVGPLPRATGNRQWLIVATDYFTKWVEAEPLARITDSESRKFIWKNKITRFGIPKCLISDNGTQFDSGPFKKYCSEFGIRNHFTSPAYPQGNGQAESSNKTILNGIKKRLEEVKGRWVEELPTILWTFRTTPRSSTGETPFSLTYGVEAVIPLEVGLPTLRSEEYDQENNELMLAKDLDLAQERRDLAMIRLASYQGDLKKRYGKSVSERILAPGDLVLRKVLGSRKDPTQGKLGANWEGPYQIISEAGLGAFNLKGMDDKPLKRPWNISNLKKFFQ